MPNFIDTLSQILQTTPDSFTENGMAGFSSSGNPLLDINFRVSSYRNNPKQAVADFAKAFKFHPELAVRWLFYMRDCRGGLGERDTFRLLFNWLLCQNIDLESMLHLIDLVPDYGRWDDFFYKKQLPVKYSEEILTMLANQIGMDVVNMAKNEKVTLCAKWMPSINTSSKDTVKLAKLLANKLKLSPKGYRKTLASLREYSKVVEHFISRNDWSSLDYSKVPSLASLKYARAFASKDTARYKAFLTEVEKGNATIHSSVTFPHDIVHHVRDSEDDDVSRAYEQMWKSLPRSNTISALVVADGSGSMETNRLGNTNVKPLDVANALAIYFSEINYGPYKDKYITFSDRPQFVDFSKADTLYDKIQIAYEHDEVASTNIEAVFDLILKTAIQGNLTQADLPENILVISDMEFNQGVNVGPDEDLLFESIKKRFKNAHYSVPRLIFWNVCSRTNTIPIRENANGLVLVSGFSPNVVNMIMDNELDPFKALLNVLSSPRYASIKVNIEQ